MKTKMTFQHIVSELKSATGLAAIDELINHLVSAGAISADASGPIAQALKQRELSMSTGIGLGVALPHASTALVNEAIVAFGRSPAGIDFDAIDRQPVRLVVLVIVPEREKEKHLKTLTQVSRLFRNDSLRAALEKAPDTKSLSDLLHGRALTSV
jgi:mannitol/fructose-specific phosphotransferase system IIA component (Ntr-type)